MKTALLLLMVAGCAAQVQFSALSDNMKSLLEDDDAPLPPKARIIQLLLAEANITISDETAGALQRCIGDQTLGMLVASDLKFFTFHLTDDEPYYEMLPPNILNATIMGKQVLTFLKDMSFTMTHYQGCSAIPNARFCMPALSSSVITSLCVPDTCTATDLNDILHNFLMAGLPPAWKQALNIYCADELTPYEDSERAKATAGIFSTIAAVAVVCTLLSMGADFLVELREEKLEKRLSGDADPLLADDDAGNLQLPTNVAAKMETEDVVLSPFWRFMACWDVRAALDDLFRISPKRPTNFLNGMRVFSIMWVILGHCIAYPTVPGTDNTLEMEHTALNYRFVLVSSGVYAVDTFFYMSGFLATYLLLKSFPKDIAAFTASTRVLLIYADRYIRLTPFYALCILFAYNLLEYLCDRPGAVLYTNGGAVGYGCNENWWRNLLYINNLGGMSHMTCMGHTWYLANDMQFFIMSIPMIVMHKMAPSQMWKLLTVIPPLLCLLISILLASTIANSFTSPSGGGDTYFYPYVRAAPYFYGVLTGFMLYDKSVSSAVKRAVKGRLCRWALYLFCAVAMWGCLSFQWAAMRSGILDVGHWGYPLQSLKQFVYHFFWGLCLGILTLIWTAGHGGRVVSFLSLPAFEPLGRVTYGVYLIHPMVYAVMRTGLLPGLVHYTDTWLIGFTVLCGCGSYLAGMIAFVFIERPVGAMWDLVSGRKKRRAVK